MGKNRKEWQQVNKVFLGVQRIRCEGVPSARVQRSEGRKRVRESSGCGCVGVKAVKVIGVVGIKCVPAPSPI